MNPFQTCYSLEMREPVNGQLDQSGIKNNIYGKDLPN